MFKILNTFLLLFACSTCFAKPAFTVCDYFLPSLKNLAGPLEVTKLVRDVDPLKTSLYETEFKGGGYKVLSLKKSNFRSWFSQIENKFDDSFFLIGANNLKITPLKFNSLWDSHLYSIKHRHEIDTVTCNNVELNNHQKQMVLFYFYYGYEIWPSYHEFLDLFVDESNHFLFFVTKLVNKDVYMGRLIQVNDENLASFTVFYDDRDFVYRTLYETALMNLDKENELK